MQQNTVLLVGVTNNVCVCYVNMLPFPCKNDFTFVTYCVLCPYKDNITHFIHYFVGTPLEDSQLSTEDPEPVGMSIILTLAFSNVVIHY